MSTSHPNRGRRSVLVACCLISLLLIAGEKFWPRVSQAALKESPVSSPKPQMRSFVQGEILVRFRVEAAAAKSTAKPRALAEMSLASEGGSIPVQVERLDAGPEIVEGLRLARVAPEETTRAIASLRARSDVVYAEPNYIRHKLAVPNDPSYAQLWGLKNTGQSGGIAGADIKAEQAWNTTTGSQSVVVAVIDEGIDVNHQDLQANIWRNPGEIPGNGIDDDGDGYVDDVNGFDFFHNDASVYDGPGTNPDGSVIDAHGTHVAGTIGASGNNGVGVVGVNWQVSLMSLKFLGPDGGTTADLLKALAYAKMMRDRWVASGGTQGANVRVTNNSYGGYEYSQAESDAIKATGDSGILFVAAAGNESQDNSIVPSYPASYDLPNVISVAATDSGDNLASFSNRGSRSVHLGAPGKNILSTTPGNTYTSYSGTSMASPHVAGAAALVLAAHPDFSVARVRASLLFGGDATGSLAQTTITGSRLNAAGALQNATEVDTVPPANLTDLHIASQNERNVTLNWTAVGDDGTTGRASLYEIRFNDSSSGSQFLLAFKHPAAAGSAESLNINVPYRHAAGYFSIRTVDNAGNTSDSNINVSVTTPEAVDPYAVTLAPATPLSTGGQPLNMSFDDYYGGAVVLPFNFPYFEQYFASVYVSTNGTLYFGGGPPLAPDSLNSGRALNWRFMVAGLWDDLDLRKCFRADADVYKVTPDNDRVILRWQGVGFTSPSCPASPDGQHQVNFEIELRRDGTIIERYGQNTPLHSVVGIGGGEPEGYLIDSHTSQGAPVDLTNAQNITYTLRRLPNLADLAVSSTSSAAYTLAGQNVTFNVTATNRGPAQTGGVLLTDTLPSAATFVSCTTSQGSCSAPAGGKLQVNVGSLASGGTVNIAITVQPTNSSFNPFVNTASISGTLTDPNQGNNLTTAASQVIIPNQNPQTGLVAVGAGGSQSFAIRSDGYGLGWGANNYGQVGNGSISDKPLPVRIEGVNQLAQIDSGGSHTIARRSDGTVWAWGRNDKGQLGDGTTADHRTAAQVPGLSGVVRVSAGGGHSLALKSDGTVWAWGANDSGQLGIGSSDTSTHTTPVQVMGLSNVTAISAGYNHSLAVTGDGSVWAWGANESGQLGEPISTGRTAPVRVSNVSNIIAVSAGEGYVFTNGVGMPTIISFSCALKSDGTVWTWGHNWRGQLGDGTMTNRYTPAQVGGLSNVTAVSAGGFHVIALRNDGTVWSWGGNFDGQLGDTTTTDRLTPVQVVWLTGIQAIATGVEHSLALRQDGHLFGWGSYSNGQLGTGGIVGSRTFPYEVTAQVPDPLPISALATPTFAPDGGSFSSAQNVIVRSADADTTVSSFSVGNQHVLAKLSNGKIYGWGSDYYDQLGFDSGYPMADYTKVITKTPVLLNGLDNVVSYSSGYNHIMALMNDGTVWTWGSNIQGELGYDTNFAPRTTPKAVPGVSGVAAIAGGIGRSLALKSDGTVVAWGWTSGGTTSPAQVSGLTNVVSIESGSVNFAIRSDGTLWGWGSPNFNGEVGDGTTTGRTSPVQVVGLAGVAAVSSGPSHTVALKSDGTVWAWGNNDYGKLGIGTTTPSSHPTPVQVPGLTGIVAVAAGGDFTLALKSDGTVLGWGSNTRGQMGKGALVGLITTPTQIDGLSNIKAIAAGYEFSAALRTDGTLFTWGANDFGQLGDGTNDTVPGIVQMKQLTGGVIIHYTTNGSDPTDSDPVLSSGSQVSVASSLTLKARAYKTGWTPSAVKSANYTIGAAANTIQLSAQSYTVSEGAGHIEVVVNRTDSSNAATVNYATSDTLSISNTCQDILGIASSRCDYVTTVGTLRFAPGESSKSIFIPIVDDAYREGPESFTITLSSPSGVTLASPSSATITITDNDTANGPNPIDNASFFVRQQYIDFLGREPDAAGLSGWMDVLNNCGTKYPTPCDRIEVSAGFFRSPEFQDRGYFVFRFYPVALGRNPAYAEFMPDLAKVSGFLDAQQLEAAKVAFVSEFMSRPEFQNKYGSLSDQAFHDALVQTAGVDPGIAFPNATMTRAEFFRAFVESTAIYQKFYNQSFVVMQYFGYLRRDPDILYLDWIKIMNQNGGDYRSMISGFINSPEYRVRFAP